jgi:hypothetical protein
MVWDKGTNPRRSNVCGLGVNETVEAELFSLGELFKDEIIKEWSIKMQY